MQPFALKQHDRETKSVRELSTEELGSVNGAPSYPLTERTGGA